MNLLDAIKELDSQSTPAPWRISDQDILGSGPNAYIASWSGESANAELIVFLRNNTMAIIAMMENAGESHAR